MSEQITSPDSVSLDTVFNAIRHWRANKDTYPSRGVPDNIWQSVFQLESLGYAAHDLCRLFSLNNHQYKRKQSQLCLAKNSLPENNQIEEDGSPTQSQTEPVIDFTEVNIDSSPSTHPIPPLTSAKQAIKHLKSNDSHYTPNVTTIIVEYIRPDGYRLKIHTVNNQLDVLLKSFLTQGNT